MFLVGRWNEARPSIQTFSKGRQGRQTGWVSRSLHLIFVALAGKSAKEGEEMCCTPECDKQGGGFNKIQQQSRTAPARCGWCLDIPYWDSGCCLRSTLLIGMAGLLMSAAAIVV